MRILPFVALLLALPACGGLRCDPVEKPLTGDIRVDAIGTWENWGIDSYVVLDLAEGGKARYVEAPNEYATNGHVDNFSYTLDGEGHIDLGDAPRLIKVNSTTLSEVSTDPARASMLSHPRVHCEGYGF